MNKKELIKEEKILNPMQGLPVLIITVLLIIASIVGIVMGIIQLVKGNGGGLLLTISAIYLCVLSWIPLTGIKVLRPNEAYVFTLFGKYYGTLKKEGMFFVNPFLEAFNPTYVSPTTRALATSSQASSSEAKPAPIDPDSLKQKISTKVLTLDNPVQKVNDELGNPINIGIVVVWKVVNPTQAVFNVENFRKYLSIQADSVLRNVVRSYPYDVSTEGDEKSLRGSSLEIAEKLKEDIQAKVAFAGLEILEAKITTLAYAQEIAAAMLQRQQASAIIDARRMIVDGAVSMVQMALDKLSEEQVVELDEERKAAMISNLMVVLCANKEAQPVVNSGSIY